MTWPSFSLPFQNYFYKVENPTVKADCIHNSSLSHVDVRQYALLAFECFKRSWEIPDFWKRANTSDACLVLIDTLFTQNPYNQEVRVICNDFQALLEKNLEYFNGEDLENKWVDDFGWWGLFGLNAHHFLVKLGNDELASKYFDLSCKCYAKMTGPVLDKSETFPVAYGCRNSTNKSPNDGTKNSVVNGLLLLLSTKLYILFEQHNLNDADKFLVTAYNQWIWFSKWFELKEYNYLRHFDGDNEAALVCERPLAFVEGSSYQSKSNPDWAPNWVWTGDQGLLIGAFLNLAAVKNKLTIYDEQHHSEWKFDENEFSKKINDITNKLIRGVQKGIIGNDGVFYEPPCLSSYVTNANDYFGGRGILVRYMELQKVKEFSGIDFEENVVKTVAALWLTRDVNTNQFAAELTNQSNHLEYAKKFDALWGFSDQIISWSIDSNPQTKDPICQAIGLDFIAAALKFHNTL